ncbi:hypothetical protein GIB67_033093 [Kingdonia uniflora]|uniref:Uncharacterized protein n=1 Tax=Kingdonia uniflora TaxID=39325 RepID=A0A7J7MYH0_9MAGN|nr:hypothetical protein GIB67_033093 [Kingdonia uniflora]
MSAKWRALQHRHRYTYTALLFPQSYIQSLNLLSPNDVFSLTFFTELQELINLNSIYAQVTHVKKLSLAFGELLGNNGVLRPEAIRFYVELLFLENSVPLHRTLISVIAKSGCYKLEIGECFRRLCSEYGNLGRKVRRFSVSRVGLSLLSYPKLGFLVEVLEECLVLIAVDIVVGLKGVVSEVNDGSRPSPVVMEQCQDAMSCSYYLLQRFPSKFMDCSDCWEVQSGLVTKDSTTFENVVDAVLGVLKSSGFSRDCLVAAGVSFCAALQVCLNPKELAYFIVKGLFRQTGCISIVSSNSDDGVLDPKVPYKGDLYTEIDNFSVLSRLCLLRGILTAVPRTVLNTHFHFSGGGMKVWTILFDGILPELCNYCENPVDSHFNFHVLTVMQICMQQIKTSVLADLANISDNYDPLPEDMGTRIIKIIWNNLEDPLNQTVKQVHLIFDLFIDIQSNLRLADGGEIIKSFLLKTATDLLCLGARCKGRYVPLASLMKRLGAKVILDMNPHMLFETVYAYIDDDVCSAATTFLKCFLECLRDECWSSDGIEKGYIIFRGHCLPPILYGLVSGVSKLRSNLNTYALPVVLNVDVDSIFPMLNFISVGINGDDIELNYPELAGAQMALTVDQKVAALVSLLKVSRLLALIEGDIDNYSETSMLQEDVDLLALVCVKGIKVKVLVKWLVLALSHVDETLRIDAAESLFLNPRTSSLPSNLELHLLKEAVPLNMRCCSTAFQMKWASLFRKFFSRVRTALERQLKQGCWQPLVGLDEGTNLTVSHGARNLFHFMKWFSCFLSFSCYPSAPYERKIMAMELILVMINTWSILPPSQGNYSYPYSEGFTLPDSTLLLVGSIIDSWDRLRENSFRILLHFPTPLPGISNQRRVVEVVTWAKKLVCSPRVRESDAGALILRLIFRKYVLELGWIVRASNNVMCFQSKSELFNGVVEISRSRFPVIEYILSLVDWLNAAVTEGEKDLFEACKNSFVHGTLLTLRYTFEELDWNSDVVLASNLEMRNALRKLLELVVRITGLALGVVSSDAWHLPEDMDDMINEDTYISDVPVEINMLESSSELQVTDLKPVDTVRQGEQVVMVGCWLAMKEVSLLLGTITRKIPLPQYNSSDSSDPRDSISEAAPDEMLDVKQLEAIGNHFLEVLLKMKHNGAIDKTRAGFTALCNRLLCSNDPRYASYIHLRNGSNWIY